MSDLFKGEGPWQGLFTVIGILTGPLLGAVISSNANGLTRLVLIGGGLIVGTYLGHLLGSALDRYRAAKEEERMQLAQWEWEKEIKRRREDLEDQDF
ncbi:MAG: hypothetical protein VX869_02780 [Chloroflexota bacterium]|jgi:hypothetical protein|nr:hypothetical protein [SAR202 cluster bacterium]MEC8891250.1 hypothetical protein [Chloroflexota bacterium]MEC9321085.1 hypothetical protein [Chloroflexota bacterium]